LDRVILHTVMHDSSTSTYIPNFIEIQETLWTDWRTVWMGGRTCETHFNRSTRRSRPKKSKKIDGFNYVRKSCLKIN